MTQEERSLLFAKVEAYLTEHRGRPFGTEPAPDHLRVETKCVDDGIVDAGNGIAYQRCGGGRRVIRKRIGG